MCHTVNDLTGEKNDDAERFPYVFCIEPSFVNKPNDRKNGVKRSTYFES